jgi:hypothetical protein
VSHLENFPLTTITDAAVDSSPAQKRVKMAPDAKPRSPADQEYLDSLSGRQLMDFRNYVRRRGICRSQ